MQKSANLHSGKRWQEFLSLLIIAVTVDHPQAHVVYGQIGCCGGASCSQRLVFVFVLQTRNGIGMGSKEEVYFVMSCQYLKNNSSIQACKSASSHIILNINAL